MVAGSSGTEAGQGQREGQQAPPATAVQQLAPTFQHKTARHRTIPPRSVPTSQSATDVEQTKCIQPYLLLEEGAHRPSSLAGCTVSMCYQSINTTVLLACCWRKARTAVSLGSSSVAAKEALAR